MGCDIHFFVEAWHENQWKLIDLRPALAFGILNKDMPGVYWVDPVAPLELLARSETKDIFLTDGEIWHCQFSLDRDYSFFAEIASVRGEGKPARGLPEDTVVETSEDFSLHGHSWMSGEEMAECKHSSCFPQEAMRAIAAHLNIDPLEDLRGVFYFDN